MKEGAQLNNEQQADQHGKHATPDESISHTSNLDEALDFDEDASLDDLRKSATRGLQRARHSGV